MRKERFYLFFQVQVFLIRLRIFQVLGVILAAKTRKPTRSKNSQDIRFPPFHQFLCRKLNSANKIPSFILAFRNLSNSQKTVRKFLKFHCELLNVKSLLFGLILETFIAYKSPAEITGSPIVSN